MRDVGRLPEREPRGDRAKFTEQVAAKFTLGHNTSAGPRGAGESLLRKSSALDGQVPNEGNRRHYEILSATLRALLSKSFCSCNLAISGPKRTLALSAPPQQLIPDPRATRRSLRVPFEKTSAMAVRGLMVSRFEVNDNDSSNQNRVLFSCLREITITLLQPPPNAAGGSGTQLSEYDCVGIRPRVFFGDCECGANRCGSAESCRGGDRYSPVSEVSLPLVDTRGFHEKAWSCQVPR
jgi:hypothetical protein